MKYRLCPECGVLIDCATVANGRMRLSCACGYLGSFTNHAFDIIPILIDSNEKKNEHIIDYLDCNNIAWKRKRLNVGDYMIDGDLSISIDKKYGCDELAGNLAGSDYSRFRKELLRAIEAKTHLIFLIEEEDITCVPDVRLWRNWRHDEWLKCKEYGDYVRMSKLHLNPRMHPITGDELMRRMVTIQKKYGVDWRFCRKDETGKKIVEILGGNE